LQNLVKVITIVENPIRTAFSNVKKDIQDLRAKQESAYSGLSTLMQSKDKLHQNQIDKLSSDLRGSFDAQKRDIWQAIDTMEDRLAEIQKTEGMHEKSLIGLRKDMAQIDKKLGKLITRLEDFEALSVEVQDVEKHFITKAEADARIHKSVETLSGDIKIMAEQGARLEQSQKNSVMKDDLKKVEKQLGDIRKSVVGESVVDSLHNRIDSFESKAGKNSDNLRADFRKMQDNMAELYDMRKSYATKDQIANLNKEIRMLTEGLRETHKKHSAIQRQTVKQAKTKASKQQPKKSGQNPIRKAVSSVKRFFVEDDSK
jgi:hypothetical protein